MWRELNQRLNQCGIGNPWPQDWAAGTYELTFYPRESIALSRLQITNDPNYVPN